MMHPGWRDAVEIALVAYVLYRALLLIHGTRALQMLFGIGLLVVIYAIAWLAKLTMITYLLNLVFTYGAFAVLVIFQPELRQALAHLGQSPVSRLLRRMGDAEVAEEIADAVERLSRSGTGAIICLEHEVPLGDYLPSGSEMQAKVSADLLQTIFTPYSPLHDGAVIVRGDTIVGAGCILPLTQRVLADRSLGTRHRAALGMSEETDALVVI
ncbi:MAG TPA: diadenylate cyclase CdaA, partial [Gemmatimonadaceae bacterium]|nr:diadenylate cyclase CdaA [Gemmatimonadaceae bacterium]